MLTTIVGYEAKKDWEDEGVANKQKEKAEEMMRKNTPPCTNIVLPLCLPPPTVPTPQPY